MTLAIGDIVTLKSGGPTMTVSSMDDKTGAQCTWYNQVTGKMEILYFDNRTLRIHNSHTIPVGPTFGASALNKS